MLRKLRFFVSIAMVVMLVGCGGGQGSGGVLDTAEDLGPYEAPPYQDSAFHRDQAAGADGVLIDISSVKNGYVGISAQSGTRLKLQILKGESTYNYDISNDGTPSILPLQCGNGRYRFRVMESVGDNKYVEKYISECNVSMTDEFEPFLRPNDYVFYSRDSECVKKSAELAGSAGDALGLVARVFDYICDTVVYDTRKAETVQAGYLPDPDETMSTGKGICFDYASLAAAMLRSQGIPTKLVFGYVSPNDLYHAWNMFYTEETGWVTVSYEARGDSWNRLDLTFSANGADSDYIGDGSNYADLYYY